MTSPEAAPKPTPNPLEALIANHSAEMNVHSNRLGLSPKVKNTLLMTTGILLTAGLVLAPSTIQGMHAGLNLPQGLIYAIGSLPLGGTWEHIDPETAARTWEAIILGHLNLLPSIWNPEIPKFTTEIGLLTNEIIMTGVVLAGAERWLHNNAVRNGTAHIKRKGEQTIVIGGTSSRIAEAITLQNPLQIIPIFESRSGGASIISSLAPEANFPVNIAKAVFQKAVFLNLDVEDSQSHRGLEAWKKLHLSRKNLLSTTGGKKVLFVVGCGEIPEEELSKQTETPDVTIEEFNTDVEQMQNRLESSGVKPDEFQTIKLYLGSADTPRIDPETGNITLTDRENARNGSIDIYLDTWRANLWAIKEELKKQGLLDKGVRLITTQSEYRQLFEKVAEELGVNLLNLDGDKDGDATLLVYERMSDETVHRAETMKLKYPGRKVLALTSNVEDDQAAKDKGIDSICSANVLGNLITGIRELIKQGYSADDIQEYLDSLFYNAESKEV